MKCYEVGQKLKYRNNPDYVIKIVRKKRNNGQLWFLQKQM